MKRNVVFILFLSIQVFTIATVVGQIALECGEENSETIAISKKICKIKNNIEREIKSKRRNNKPKFISKKDEIVKSNWKKYCKQLNSRESSKSIRKCSKSIKRYIFSSSVDGGVSKYNKVTNSSAKSMIAFDRAKKELVLKVLKHGRIKKKIGNKKTALEKSEFIEKIIKYVNAELEDEFNILDIKYLKFNCDYTTVEVDCYILAYIDFGSVLKEITTSIEAERFRKDSKIILEHKHNKDSTYNIYNGDFITMSVKATDRAKLVVYIETEYNNEVYRKKIVPIDADYYDIEQKKKYTFSNPQIILNDIPSKKFTLIVQLSNSSYNKEHEVILEEFQCFVKSE